MSHKSPILLLEDDRMLLDLMQDGLSDEGYTVLAIRDPERLQPELERLGGRAILVADRDIGAQVASGFDIAAAALEQFPALRVIYVSGTQLALKHRQLSPRERSLLKPFAISQLSGLAKQLA